MKSKSALAFLAVFLAKGPSPAGEIPENFRTDKLVAWCIVPFDAKKRDSEARAKMLVDLGLRRCAYDWRKEHVPQFEDEIRQYEKHGIEFTAFWNRHEDAFRLFSEHEIRPQIWITNPSPDKPAQADKVEAATARLHPVAEEAAKHGCILGLYNHGGWGGEPENLVAVCRRLRKLGYPKTGIVYNFHHSHHRIESFEADFALMKPFLLCLNLNGMNANPDPKILPIGQGTHEAKMIRFLAENYTGPVGILDHRQEIDAKESLKENLEGLKKILE